MKIKAPIITCEFKNKRLRAITMSYFTVFIKCRHRRRRFFKRNQNLFDCVPIRFKHFSYSHTHFFIRFLCHTHKTHPHAHTYTTNTRQEKPNRIFML